MGVTKPVKPKGSVAKGTIGLLLVCVAAAAMLLAARRPIPSNEQMAALSAPPVNIAAEQQPKPATVTLQKKTKTAATVTPAPVQAAVVTPEMAADKGAVEKDVVAAKGPAVESTSATIAGCLERDGDTFLLKDSEGADAPKARSWKSGFLKKGTPRISVIDMSNRLNLIGHVGERVSISGMLAEREMQARSVRRVAGSCE
jgi:hypothetical protein